MSGDLLTPTEDDQSPLFEGDNSHGVYDNESERGQGRGHAGTEASDGEDTTAKQLSGEDLGAAEAAAGSGAGNDEAAAAQEETSNFSYKGGRGAFSAKGLAKNKWLWAGGAGGGLLVALVLLLFLLLGQLKVISFSQVLTTTAYARFGDMLQERWGSNLMDQALVEGNGTLGGFKSTVLDNLRAQNPNYRLSQLGRDDKIKFQYNNDGDFTGVRVGDQAVSLDGITKEFNFGDGTFKSINSGLSKYSLENIRSRASVRKAFVDRANGLGEGTILAEESSAVRSRFFGYLSDQVGFKFSRWRQAGRDLLGKDPIAASAEDTASTVSDVAGTDVVNSGVDSIDSFLKDSKNPDFIKKLVTQNDGNPEIQGKLAETYAANVESATKIQSGAEAVGKLTLLLSVACMVHIAANHVDDSYKANVKQAQNLALRLSAAGSQSQFGDTVSEAVQVESTKLDGAETAPSYQYETGVSSVGMPANFSVPHLRPGIQSDMVALAQQLTSVTRLSGAAVLPTLVGTLTGTADQVNRQLENADMKVCGALLSPQGAVIAVSAELVMQIFTAALSGGVVAGASEATAGQLTFQLLSAVVKGMGGTVVGLFKSLPALVGIGAFSFGLSLLATYLGQNQFSGLSTGPAYYEQLAMGANLNQGQQMRTMMGGRPISSAEAKGVDANAYVTMRLQNQHQSFIARFFSLRNPYSLATAAIVRAPNSLQNFGVMAQSAVSHLGSTLTGFMHPFTSLFFGRAFAQSTSNYDPYQGIQQYGYSPDELNKIHTDDSYSLLGNEKWFADRNINPDTDPSFGGTYGTCFDPQMNQYDAMQMLDTASPTYKSQCTSIALSNDNAFRYRIHLMDNFVVDDMTRNLKQPVTAGV